MGLSSGTWGLLVEARELLVVVCMRDLIPDRTWAPRIGSSESYPLDNQGSLYTFFLQYSFPFWFIMGY